MWSLSKNIGSALTSLHRAGAPAVAAGIANLIHRDRAFSIDPDGDWVNRQRDATFVSPDPHMIRLSYLAERTREEWFHAYTPKPTDVVFDVGAGIGEEAVVLSTLVSQVYAVEAHPRTFRCLEKTIKQSGRTNVTAIHCALAGADGTLRIGTARNHLASTVVAPGHGGDEVPARSLASLCREFGIAEVNFLKMNIEGAERLAIGGLGSVPIHNLAISCHDFIAGPEYQTREVVAGFLVQQGYRIELRREDPRPWTREMVYGC